MLLGVVMVNKLFFAKQPILDRLQQGYGYELLYRDGKFNELVLTNGDLATVDIIIHSFLGLGIDESKLLFVHFSEKILEIGLPHYINSQLVIVEVLENVPANRKVKKAIKNLFNKGYKIALEDIDFISFLKWKNEDMFDYVHYIKIDVTETDREKQLLMIELLKKDYPHIRILAKKVETEEQFLKLRDLGFDLFQGYFFTQPIISERQDIPTSYVAYLNILEEINLANNSSEQISTILKNNLSLSRKIINLVNINRSHKNYKIESIHQAVVLLGGGQIKKWIYFLAVSERLGQANSSPAEELIRLSYFRAIFCEGIGRIINNPYSEKYFLIGYFSLLPSMFSMDTKCVFNQLNLDSELLDGLSMQGWDMTDTLILVKAIERAEWTKIDYYCHNMGISNKQLRDLYGQSMELAEEMLLSV